MNKENQQEKISEKNAKFFNDNTNYRKNINNIDTYQNIRNEISEILAGTENLLDIGHGGVFDYNTDKINKIIGLDLEYMNSSELPNNIELVKGSVLEIPDHLKYFDKIFMNMLLHHLCGKNVKENFDNLNRCFYEIKKKIGSNGELIIVESCVPLWFNIFEKLVYRLVYKFILRFFKHPPVFQFTINQIIEALVNNGYKIDNFEIVKQGKYILQFGYKFPTILTPVKTVIFRAKIS
tara:strand:+ start:6949 stop:7656 length:708 start_codon:yes stop_codon:yes gene_type:complete